VSIRPDTETNQVLDAIDYGIGETKQKITPVKAHSLPAITATTSYPDRDGWRANITRSLSAIDRNEIDKIVLARRLDYHFEERIDPVSLMMALRNKNRSSFTIIHQPRPGVAFVSATPERLYLREGRTVAVDAISSTMPRGTTPDEDAILERKLFQDDKLRREHRFVSDTVHSALTSLCDGEPDIDGPRALKLDRIQHIASILTGRLKPDTDDARIIETLHPTPAVAGVPRAKAIEMIVEMEPFVRGWYAGAIGVIDGDRAEFAVGIRSMIVHDESVSVFTGGGIVRGSDPDREWDEIESKDILRPLLPEKALS